MTMEVESDGLIAATQESGAPGLRPIVYFATTSDVKFAQYKRIFHDHAIELLHGTAISSVLIEPQVDYSDSGDAISLVSHPLRQAARFAMKARQVPYMIEDTMLFIASFSKDFNKFVGLPGPDTKNWWYNLEAHGVLRLLEGCPDRRASFACQLGLYLGESRYVFAFASLSGSIATDVRVSQVAYDDRPMSNPSYFHQIFVPCDDTRTLAEMAGADFARLDYRRQCVVNLLDKVKKHGYTLGSNGPLQLPHLWDGYADLDHGYTLGRDGQPGLTP